MSKLSCIQKLSIDFMVNKKHLSFQLTDFPFHYETKTRWKDMDSFGHVNNANYLTFIEDARITLFKRWKLNEKSKSLIVASIKIDYLNQLKHPCEMVIGQRISRIGNKSFDIESVIFEKGSNISFAFSLITCVCYDYERNLSISVFPDIIADYN